MAFYRANNRCQIVHGIDISYRKVAHSNQILAIVRALKVYWMLENRIRKQSYGNLALGQPISRICCHEYHRGKGFSIVAKADFGFHKKKTIFVTIHLFRYYRFLKPSQVQGIDTEAFMRQQQVANNIHEQSILGYRGLVGKV